MFNPNFFKNINIKNTLRWIKQNFIDTTCHLLLLKWHLYFNKKEF